MARENAVEGPFPAAEYRRRIANCRARMVAAGLDALLLFAQESLYYLTGFDSGGYVFFQCAVLTADNQPITLLTRRPDRDQARATSNIDDIRIWLNAEDAAPATMVREIMAEKGLKDAEVGIELNTYGLTAYNYELVRQALAGFCRHCDASDIVRGLRGIKSPAEIEIIRRAAELADRALIAAVEATRAGVPDSLLSAAILNEILTRGGDVPPGGPLVNSGNRSSFGRGIGGPRLLAERDQVIVEFAATYRRYNACIERTIVIGEPPAPLSRMYETAAAALQAMSDAARPGQPLGSIDDAHRRVFDAAGYQGERFEACGYSLGATYRPTWMDVPPMLYAGNPMPAAPGMVLFLHAIVGSQDTGLAVGLGHTLLIDDQGAEILTKVPLELHRR